MLKNIRVLFYIISGCAFSSVYAQAATVTNDIVSPSPAELVEEVTEVETVPADVPVEVVSVETEEVSLVSEDVEETVGSELIDFSCVDMALPEVIRLFTRASGANIVATTTEELKEAKVTVELKQVQWKPALNSILNMHNYELIQEDPTVEIYVVGVKQPNALPPISVETMFLKYTTTGEMLPIVKNLLAADDSRAKISVFESRNAMVIKSTLEEFGVNLSAGPFEYSKMKMTDNATGNENTDWDIRRRADVLAETADYNGNYNGDGSTANGALDGYEGAYNPDSVSGQTSPAGSPYSLIDSIDSGQDIVSDSLSQFAENITESQSAILNVDALNLVLSALQRTEGVHMISNPKMLVASGHKDAKFGVGEREPIVKTTIERGTTDSPGDKVTAELDTSINTEYITQGYMRTGIELLVVPFVKTEKYIQAEIAPSLIRKTGEKVVEGNSWPIIAVKEIKTLFTLQSGQTVAIGGLTSSSEEDTVTKIPFLGDIPFIGKYLFSHTSTDHKQTETIIFVTLSIADPDNLDENMGVPEDSKLVYKRLLKQRLDKKEFDKEYNELKNAADEKIRAIEAELSVVDEDEMLAEEQKKLEVSEDNEKEAGNK
jgi:type II secretory pathway component GspD/PulD (secretin)